MDRSQKDSVITHLFPYTCPYVANTSLRCTLRRQTKVTYIFCRSHPVKYFSIAYLLKAEIYAIVSSVYFPLYLYIGLFV